MAESKLLKAVTLLENAGFHVDKANEENCLDVGYPSTYAGEKTGAICLRITPANEDIKQR